MKNILVVYGCIVILCGLAIFALLEHGRQIQRSRGPMHPVRAELAAPSAIGVSSPQSHAPVAGWAVRGLVDNLQDPLSRLFIQLIVIVLAARGVGALFTRM